MKFDVDVDNLLNGTTGVGTAGAVVVAAADYDGASLTIASDAVEDVITVSDGTNTGTASALSDNTAGQALSVTVGTETLDFVIDQSTLTSGEVLSTTIQSEFTISLSDTSGPAQIGSDFVVTELELADPSSVSNISFGASGLLVDLDATGLLALSSQAASYDQTITVGESTEYTAQLQNADGSTIVGAGQFALTGTGDDVTIDLGKDVVLTYDEADLAEGDIFFGVNDNVTEFTFDLTGAGTASTTIQAGETADFGNGITMDTDDTLATSAGTITFEVENTTLDNSVNMQIGANTGQKISIAIDDVGSVALGVSASTASATNAFTVDGKNYVANFKAAATVEADGDVTEFSLDISSYENATAAVHIIDTALTSISDQRAKLGAVQNRLEHTIKNLDTSSENLQASESRIRDVDMAKEMMEYTKNNILQQAAQAMLAQANQAPQGVLQLLR
ncbi:hypothetical protein KHM83_03750 [Fusibacter paucivorans]|uniref:Flagellin C-terminal domain-containing protein n=1 Tax=Fusibacter paucivorans TaxID=76009 RepID=A0ABS5PKT4_9FIRM|nr:hypothetical protein [Fusibacter paucivorans]